MKSKTIHNMSNEELDDFIERNLPIKEVEKNKYGEVFTPIPLIEEMLDELPKNLWNDPSKKWLDPTCGVGNFMICVYKRLMKSLANWDKNRAKLSAHIVTNMLFMCDINASNVRACKSIFGAEANIYKGDFLGKSFGADFDVIVGNPPFQDDVTSNDTSNMRPSGGKSKLYERILQKSIDVLSPKGYLTFLTPDNLFSGSGVKGYKTLLDYKVHKISFSDSIGDYFPKIQQYICYFILEKTAKPNNYLTTICNSNNQILHLPLLDRPLNPVRNWTNKTEQLVKKYISNEKNTSTIYNRGKPVSSYRGNKYPLIYTPSKTLHTNNSNLAIGFGRPKIVIYSMSPELQFKADYRGAFGAGPNTFAVFFDTNRDGKMLERFLNSDTYKTLAHATKTSRQFIKNAFIQHLNIDRILNTFVSSTRKRKGKSGKHKTKKNIL